MRALTMTQFRRTLGEQIDNVRAGGPHVMIYRFGRPAAALVSIEMLERVLEAEDEVEQGPLKADGNRFGGKAWRALRAKLGLARPDFRFLEDVRGKVTTTGPSFREEESRDVENGRRLRAAEAEIKALEASLRTAQREGRGGGASPT